MQKSNKGQLILASQSPRRKELMKWIYVPYRVVASEVEEISLETNVHAFVTDLARQKACDVFEKVKKTLSNPFIIGADTIVVIDDEILGKPKDRNDAKKMLLKLKGKSHFVLTGVCIKYHQGEELFYEKTKVYFDEISDELMELYLDTGESLDKAGAYGIQGAALGFIGKLEGSYSNVVGLPVNLLLQKLQSLIEKNYCKNWRDYFED